MDRLTRTLAGLSLALVATTAGCHHTREKVPPHTTFRNDGKAATTTADSNPVEFSTKQHDPSVTAAGMIGGAPGNAAQTNSPLANGPTSNGPFSSTSSAGNAYGNLTTDNRFGGPGSSGLGTPPAMSPAGGTPSYPPQPTTQPKLYNDINTNPTGANANNLTPN